MNMAAASICGLAGFLAACVQVLRDGKLDLPVHQNNKIVLNDVKNILTGFLGGITVGILFQEVSYLSVLASMGVGLNIIQLKDIVKKRKGDIE